MRTDRGEEYFSNSLHEYLRAEGNQFQCTVGYAPQQNGISERKNRTLMEGAHTVLAESNVPKFFWNEAVRYVNYTFNRIGVISPLEKFYGIKPDLNTMHTFGCEVYVMIPYEKRKK